jgi:hypothetical protein
LMAIMTSLQHQNLPKSTLVIMQSWFRCSEMAMLNLLVLCDLSGAHCGFYDEILTLLRWRKKGIRYFQGEGMRFIS